MKRRFKKSRMRGISYIQYKEGRLTGLVTSCPGTAFSKKGVVGRIEVTGRRGRRREQLLNNLKKRTRYRKLKEEVPVRTL